MNAADRNAPSEIAVNLIMTSTVPTTLTHSKIVFPVSGSQFQLFWSLSTRGPSEGGLTG
jgi:hypothetical protein